MGNSHKTLFTTCYAIFVVPVRYFIVKITDPCFLDKDFDYGYVIPTDKLRIVWIVVQVNVSVINLVKERNFE